MLSRSRVLVTSALCLFMAGCASYYAQRGTELYAGGRYVEAAEVFEHAEPKLANSSPEQQAEYGLYRGATLLALNDYERAKRWLAYSYQIEQAYPGALETNQRAFLYKTWETLSRNLRTSPALVPEAPGSAIAASGQPRRPEATAPATNGLVPANGLIPAQRSFVPQ